MGELARLLVCSGLITVAAGAVVGVERRRSQAALGRLAAVATGEAWCVNVLAVVKPERRAAACERKRSWNKQPSGLTEAACLLIDGGLHEAAPPAWWRPPDLLWFRVEPGRFLLLLLSFCPKCDFFFFLPEAVR